MEASSNIQGFRKRNTMNITTIHLKRLNLKKYS